MVATNFKQQLAHEWALRCFGSAQVMNTAHRGMRTVEEAIELAQVCGVTREKMHDIVEHVYNKPVGSFHQEAGGVLLTLAILCETTGHDMETCLDIELARVLNKSVQHFKDRDDTKARAGLVP